MCICLASGNISCTSLRCQFGDFSTSISVSFSLYTICCDDGVQLVSAADRCSRCRRSFAWLSGDMKDTASPWRSCKHYYTDNNICYCALLVTVYFSLFPGNTIWFRIYNNNPASNSEIVWRTDDHNANYWKESIVAKLDRKLTAICKLSLKMLPTRNDTYIQVPSFSHFEIRYNIYWNATIDDWNEAMHWKA